MKTSKWIVIFACAALITGVALASSNKQSETNCDHGSMTMDCGMAKADMDACPHHANSAPATAMGCCGKEAAKAPACPMHAEHQTASAPSCHGDHAASDDAPAHAAHH